MPDTMELQDVRKMTVDEKVRELFRLHAENIATEGKRVLASIKDAKTCEEAMAWRVKQRDYIQSVENSEIGLAKAYYHKKWKEHDAEIDAYVDPAKEWMKKVKEKTDQWYLAERERLKLLQEKVNAKTLEKAEEKQQIKVQTLMDLGKPKAAMLAASRPLIATPPIVAMPKIKGAVWKKRYMVQIDDLGALLTYIAKNPKYHNMIDVPSLMSKLEAQATVLDGNMKEFKGVRCLETVNSAAIGGPR